MIAALELRVALAQRRLFVMNTVVPLTLVLPVAFAGAPRVHAAVVFTLLFTFFGVFGQAIPLARDAERGLTARYFLAGVSPHGFFAQRIITHAAIDFAQLTPAFVVIALAYQTSAPALAALAAGALLALIAANAIGALIACVARSIAEAALFSSIVALFMLHGAGVFRSPVPDGVADQIRAGLPFSRLHQAVQAAIGTPVASPTGWSASLAGAAALFALLLLLSPWLAGTLTRVRTG